MKQFNFFAIAAIAAATVVMTSCGNDDEVVNDDDRVAVQFSTNTADVQTRVEGTSWNGNEHIGIYMLKSNYSLSAANISESVNNREYETANSGATVTFSPTGDTGDTDNTIYYPVAGNVKFIAYYPYSSSIADFKLPINVANQSVQSDIDVLYAPTADAYTKTSGTVTLPFVHKLVKLTFNISNDASVTTALTGLTVTIDKLSTTGTLDLATGAVTTTNANQTVTAKTAADGTSSEAIVFPAADNTGVTLTFKNSINEEFTASVPTPESGWTGGAEYTYTVTLTKTASEITGSISNWDYGSRGNVTAE
jgi:endonuclease G